MESWSLGGWSNIKLDSDDSHDEYMYSYNTIVPSLYLNSLEHLFDDR